MMIVKSSILNYKPGQFGALQLSKWDKSSPLVGFKGGSLFYKNNKKAVKFINNLS